MELYTLVETDFEDLKQTGFHFQMTYNDYDERILLNAPHSHAFYEVVYIINGYCIQNINNKSYRCVGGDMTVLMPGDIHYFESSQKNTAVMCLSIAEKMIEPFLKLSDIFMTAFHLKNINRIVKLTEAQNAVILSLCSSELSIMNYSQIKLEKIKVLLFNIIQFFSLNNMPDTDSPYRDSKISHLNDILLQMTLPKNIKEGMNALIKLTNFSHSYLCKLFKEEYNITPHQYITNLKMQHAYELIMFSDNSFEEIAEKVGYSSLSHFSKAITKFYNQTPSSIRKSRKNIISENNPS